LILLGCLSPYAFIISASFLLRIHINPNTSPRATNAENGYPGKYIYGLTVLITPHPMRRFCGSAGQAIVSKTAAYLVTDSRYWLQAREELDPNWYIIPAGGVDAPKDWIEWLVVSDL
jgi:hypothetical protein